MIDKLLTASANAPHDD